MLRQSVLSILILLCISIGKAEDNNLFIMDSQPAKKTTNAPPPVKKNLQQNLVQKETPAVIKEPPKPVTKIEVPRVEETQPQEPLFIDYGYWELGTEENLEQEHAPSTPSAVESSEVKSSSAIIESSPRPKPRPQPKPSKKPETKPAKPEPEVKPKPAPKAEPETTKAPAKEEKPAAGGLRCDKPKGVAKACSENGIREGLEKVLSDCNTVRCYIKLFHMETSCRPFLTHQALVTAYGMCSIEKDYNLRKRFGSDCHKIDTVDRQIKCCRKMMITVGKKYFEPVKVGRLAKCE